MIAPSISRPSLRRLLVPIHRWLSLGAALFWLVQALTGIAILFHWEIDDGAYPSLHRPTDLAAIERRIDMLEARGATIMSVWTTAGADDRYTINLESGSVRIAGDGTELKPASGEKPTLLRALVGIHHDLLGNAFGSWIVSLSGLLLLANLCLGLAAAWPRRGWWRTSLVPSRKGPLAARLNSWHRAIGLWAVLPALLIVGTGVLLKFENGVSALIGVSAVSLPALPSTGAPIGFAAASSAALSAIPGSTLTAVRWPKADDATFNIRVRAPGEVRRAYGASIVLVDANTGAVRGVYPIAQADAPRRSMSALFPLHTGESGGIVGRLLAGLVGLWIVTMTALGILTWVKRRRPRRS